MKRSEYIIAKKDGEDRYIRKADISSFLKVVQYNYQKDIHEEKTEVLMSSGVWLVIDTTPEEFMKMLFDD